MLSMRRSVQTDYEVLSDKIVAAMETGNTGEARRIVAEHLDTFPGEIKRIRAEVLTDYGIRI